MFNSVYQNRYEHMREIIERHGGQTRVAEKMGVSKQYINLVGSENATKKIGDRMARKIESAFGLPIGTTDQEPGSKRAEMDALTVSVPMLNAVVSMGAGASQAWTEETIQDVRFSKRWLRHNTEASSFETLAIVTAKGDSMEPTIGDGSVALVDTAVTQLRVDGIYVLLRDGDLFIKRIQRNLDGSCDVISDNPTYRPQHIQNPGAAGLLVLGRVLLTLKISKM